MKSQDIHLGVFLAMLTALLVACGHASDGIPSNAAASSGAEICSDTNPDGICPDPEKICEDGLCVPADEQEDIGGSPEGAPEGEIPPAGGEQKPGATSIPGLYIDGAADNHAPSPPPDSAPDGNDPAPHLFVQGVRIPMKVASPLQKFPAAAPPSEEACSMASITSQGIHASCSEDLELGFNYTDSPKSNYGACELFVGDEPVSKKQYFYSPENRTLSRHEVLKDCVLMMSCYEGITGTMGAAPFAWRIQALNPSAGDIRIAIRVYHENQLWEESNMGDVVNASLILADMGMPVDDEVIATTAQYTAQFLDFLQQCL